ncbi:alpha/beta fold hydrolase [Paraburkholderia sp. MM5482-R1]|uniref:alpha/beta fold hydrolase n=1 Tax=Paraburkholderia sp. MM5482-R1 TaxID=2991063 RepID=UPI003D262692
MTAPRPVLLLLPGLLCDHAAWSGPAALLAAQAECRIPSWGKLDSIEAMAAQVLATVPEPRFALAGHSMGGRIALEIIRQAPQRVERLALLDTGYQPLAAGDAGERERAGRYALLAQAREQGMRAMGAAWAVGMVLPAQVGTPLFESILDMIERSSPEQFDAQIHALLGRPDATGLLAGIRCPTLLLCGREDRWSPLERHADMHEQIPGAVLEIIERSGHMTTMEAPHDVVRALLRWLDRKDPRAEGKETP